MQQPSRPRLLREDQVGCRVCILADVVAVPDSEALRALDVGNGDRRMPAQRAQAVDLALHACTLFKDPGVDRALLAEVRLCVELGEDSLVDLLVDHSFVSPSSAADSSVVTAVPSCETLD